jgi:uncharacterized membrane protein YeiB
VRPVIAQSEAVAGFTVIVNVQDGPVVLFTVTVVVPNGKTLPDAGEDVTVPHEPEVWNGPKLTMAPHCPGSLDTTISSGQVTEQGAPIDVLAVAVLLFAFASSPPDTIAVLKMRAPSGKAALT